MATARKTAAKKPAPAPEPEEIEDDLELEEEDDELEELDESEAEETAPKKKKKSNLPDQSVEFGASDLALLASQGKDKAITARDLRTLLRKMARDGRLAREITAGNRTRYSWSGPNDPEVKIILKALKGGELEQGKQEALAKLKEGKAERVAAKAKVAAKGKVKKKAAPVIEDDEDDDDDE